MSKGLRAKYKCSKFIVFYDKDDVMLYTFDNVHQILEFRQMPITPMNVRLIDTELCRALKRETHRTNMLKLKRFLYVYVFDDEDCE